jgi:hypothetical protein
MRAFAACGCGQVVEVSAGEPHSCPGCGARLSADDALGCVKCGGPMQIHFGPGGDKLARCAHCGAQRDLPDGHGTVIETVKTQGALRIVRREVRFTSQGPPDPGAIDRALQAGSLSSDAAARLLAQELSRQLQESLRGPERPRSPGLFGWLRRLFTR